MGATTKLLTLIERVEGATADQQREMLLEAYSAIYPDNPLGYWTSTDRARRFVAMLEAEAFESAAMTLVPEGRKVTIEHEPNCGFAMAGYAQARVYMPNKRDGYDVAEATTPALALTAACLRAHASLREGGEQQ
jgi:hypothetical protein